MEINEVKKTHDEVNLENNIPKDMDIDSDRKKHVESSLLVNHFDNLAIKDDCISKNSGVLLSRDSY